MSASTLASRRWAWMTALVILLASLVPALSAGMARSGAQANWWQEVCSAQNLSKATSSSSDGGLDQAMEHCPLCTLQTHGVGLPPGDFTLSLPARVGHDTPLLFLQAPRTLFAWSAALARAPPFSS